MTLDAPEVSSEAARLTDWIHRQHLPIGVMAAMLVEERAGLRAQIAALERRAGLDLARVVTDTACGVALGLGLGWLLWA